MLSSNHKFSFLIEKARQFCGTVQSFGNALFSAIEKKDNEELTLIRSIHEQNIVLISSKVKQNNLEQAQVSLNQVLQNKVGLEMKITHYTSLLDEQNTYLHCEKLIDTANGADMIKITAISGF